jgi:hypothetical protein
MMRLTLQGARAHGIAARWEIGRLAGVPGLAQTGILRAIGMAIPVAAGTMTLLRMMMLAEVGDYSGAIGEGMRTINRVLGQPVILRRAARAVRRRVLQRAGARLIVAEVKIQATMRIKEDFWAGLVVVVRKMTTTNRPNVEAAGHAGRVHRARHPRRGRSARGTDHAQ